MEKLIHTLLAELGENPQREGLLKTPERVSKSLRQLTRGYSEDPRQIIASALFNEPAKEMVLVRDIDFFSLCEHHLLPFYGRCHLAYLPNDKILGLSKLARVVEVFSRRLQVQERLTREIAETLHQELGAQGVAVVMEAHHLCMMMRGVEKQRSVATTSCMLGEFRHNAASRQEFLSLINCSLGKS